jgi:hypothetical protein
MPIEDRVSRAIFASAMAFLAASLVCRPARADDAAAALEELKEGYALKQANDCPRAVPHLERSVELSPSPKAMLNLADCELRTGDLVGARTHAAGGRALAQSQNDTDLATVAARQLGVVDGRLPWLTVRLGPFAPEGTMVLRDHEALPHAALDVPVPINPGAHRLFVWAPGRSPRELALTIGEGERADVVVEPGPAPIVATAAPAADTPPRKKWGPSPPFYAALGVSVAGLAVGIGTGVAGQSKHAALERECGPGGACPPAARSDLDDFHTLRTWSTVSYGLGAAGLAGAFVLWFVAPQGGGAAPRVSLGLSSASLTWAF